MGCIRICETMAREPEDGEPEMTEATKPGDGRIMIPAWVDGRLEPVEKLEVHRRGLRHMAVSVFLLREGALLLQRRAAGKYHTPGLWANACCTHPSWAEAPADCARRRLREELGVTGVALERRMTVEYRAEVGAGLIEHEVAEIFVGDAPPDLRMDPAPDEVMATRWASPEELIAEIEVAPERFTPWLRIYLREHGNDILGDPDPAGEGPASHGAGNGRPSDAGRCPDP